MNIPSASRLFELAYAFNEAAAAYLENTPTAKEKVIMAATPDDEIKMKRMVGEVMQIVVQAATSEDMTEEAFLELSAPFKIRGIEIMANLLSRALGDDEVSALVPKGDRSEEASIGFEMQNNPTLARMFAPK
ncbi:MAG: hypothetical protein HY370_06975 [Proteobacteria bacterium]|nr:hypothetical protein [Pseudomonadota bacterium]